jgi:hypothetical protein
MFLSFKWFGDSFEQTKSHSQKLIDFGGGIVILEQFFATNYQIIN